MKLSRAFRLLGFLAVGCAQPALAGINSFTQTGPIGVHVTGLAVDSISGATVVIGTTRGIAQSTDGGQTFQYVYEETDNAPMMIEFARAAPNRVIASDGALYLSEDYGHTFRRLTNPINGPAGVQSLSFTPDGALVVLSSNRVFRAAPPFATWTELNHGWSLTVNATTLEVDPSNAQTIYVAVEGVGLHRSDNGGTSWTAALTNGFASAGGQTNVQDIAIDPFDSNHVLAATNAGIQRSLNRGASWTVVDPSPTFSLDFSTSFSAAGRVYSARGLGDIMESHDNAATWPDRIEQTVSSNCIVRHVPTDYERLLVGCNHGLTIRDTPGPFWSYSSMGIRGGSGLAITKANDGHIFVGMDLGFGSVFRRGFPNYLDANGTFGTYISNSGARSVRALTVAPSDSNHLWLVNNSYDLIHSTNGGTSWSGVFSQFEYAGTPDYMTGVHVAPNDSNVVYVTRAMTGIWRSLTGGTVNPFTRLVNSPPFVRTVAIDRINPNILWAAGGPTDADATGIYVSTDGGQTWNTRLAPGVSTLAVSRIVIDPDNALVAYAIAPGGVRKTVNGGNSWSLVDFGGSIGTTPFAYNLLIDPVSPSTLIMVNGGQPWGFARSVDDGATWSQTTFDVPEGRESALWDAVLATPGEIVATTPLNGIVEYTVAPDLALTMSTLAAVLPRAATVTPTFTVRNLGPHASSASALTITLPPWLTPTTPGNCLRVAQTITCDFGPMQVGQRIDIPLPLLVGNSTQTQQITASLTGHEQDASSANNSLQVNVSEAELADLGVTMNASATAIDHGELANFTVDVTNAGPSPSTNTQLSFNFSGTGGPQVLNVATTAGSCSASLGTGCNLGTRAAGSTARITFQVRGTLVGAIGVSATADGNGSDANNANDTAARSFTVRAVSDVAVTLAESADPVTLGAPFQYIATVRNLGPDSGAISLSIPVNGATVTGTNVTAGSCSSTSASVTCGLTPLSFAQATVTIDVIGTTVGIATATATATFDGTDPVSSNNTATIGTNVRVVSDVALTIADVSADASLDSAFQYTFRLHNRGPNAASGSLQVSLAGASISRASAGCTTTASSATCIYSALASDAEMSFGITVTGSAPGTAIASATVNVSGADLETSNNVASASTIVRRVGDVGVEIVGSATAVTAGTAFTYSTILRNLGPNLGAIHVTVPVTGATITSVVAQAGGTCAATAAQVECDLASLPLNNPVTISINATAGAAGTTTAAASATFGGTDPVTANNTATASVTINAAPPPPSSSSSSSSGSGGGKKGGGGRFDWLGLLALGLLAAARRERRQISGRCS
jgi:photosystem II stability/assembly factor-like uncharacterized protein